MKARTIVVVCALAALVVTVAGSVNPSSRAVSDSDLLSPKSNLSAGQAANFEPYALYAVAEDVDGHRLTARIRTSDADSGGREVRREFVSFIYGWCRPQDDSGCAPPVEVQVWPACERSFSSYSPLATDGAEVGQIRDVPAAYFGHLGRPRLELYTGTVTVVIFGETRRQVFDAAEKLEGVNTARDAGSALPAPAAGGVGKDVSCSAG